MCAAGVEYVKTQLKAGLSAVLPPTISWRQTWHDTCIYMRVKTLLAVENRRTAISNGRDCEKSTKGGRAMSALPLRKEEKVRYWVPEGIDEELIDEYLEAIEKYGPGYPDSGWFKRAAKLEREVQDARLEARFDEN